MIRWETPELLLLLWLVPLVGALLWFARRRQKLAACCFAEQVMLPRLMPPAEKDRFWPKSVLLLVGLALLIGAAARPRWGEYFEDVQSRGVDLFVVLDVSRSMLADDVAPNRLQRAKSDIRDLLPRLTGDRVGLIVFAGTAVVQVPLTTDRAFFLSALEEAGPHSVPRGGTLIGDAIRKALAAMPPRHDRDQVLVLITDGEDHDSFPQEAARQAAERGVKIISIGLGDTEEGRRIPLRGQGGSLAYLRHQEQEVWSKMDEKLLKDLALTTGGAYVPARTRAYDLGQIYEEHLKNLTRGAVSTQRKKRYYERFQWLAALGWVALLLELAVPRYPRQRGTGS